MNATATRSDVLLCLIITYQNSHGGRLPKRQELWEPIFGFVTDFHLPMFVSYANNPASMGTAHADFLGDLAELMRLRRLRYSFNKELEPTEVGRAHVRRERLSGLSLALAERVKSSS